MRFAFILLILTSVTYAKLISGFEYGVLPTDDDLYMSDTDYTFTIAMLGLTSAFAFWLGWNSYR